MTTRGLFRPHEVGSRYVGPEDRYVVSLLVGYTAEAIGSPREAALCALARILEGPAPTTHWCVYDRVADRVHVFEQRDLEIEEIDAA